MRLSVFGVDSQEEALRQLAKLTERSTVHPLIQETAKRITMACAARDDDCEVQAIFDAVKNGTATHLSGFGRGSAGAAAAALRRGVRYVADPRWADHFTAPYRLLQQCTRGACAGDCDDHAALIAALLGSLGFLTGLRVWGPKGGDFVHVYAVVALPKRDPQDVVGLDSTVETATVGWEPPPGNVLTAWLE